MSNIAGKAYKPVYNPLEFFNKGLPHLTPIWEANNKRIYNFYNNKNNKFDPYNINEIIKINKLGFFTEKAQEGVNINNFDNILLKDDEKLCQIRSNYQQRAYVSGYISNYRMLSFKYELKKINPNLFMIDYLNDRIIDYNVNEIVLSEKMTEYSDYSVKFDKVNLELKSPYDNLKYNFAKCVDFTDNIKDPIIEFNDWKYIVIIDLRLGYNNYNDGLFTSITRALINTYDEYK